VSRGDQPTAPEDPRLFRLKREAREGVYGEHRTPFTVASGLLVAAAGGLLIAGAVMPWLSIAGQSVAAVREGGPDGAAATWSTAVGAVFVVIGLLAAVGRRDGRPRFVHWATLLLAPLTWALVEYRSNILGNLVFVHNADLRSEGLAVIGPGIRVVYAGIALSLAAPLLSLRQALRALRA
jgi:hypothetical protein